MTQLVDDLLEFSKLEDGQITIEMVPFCLNDIVKETSANIKAVYDQKPIQLLLELDPALDIAIASDPFRINQILYNLIGNAYKFTDKGNITVSTKLETKNRTYSAVIQVSDTGIGISKEKQQDIFNAFTQISQNNRSKDSGFGLGLAISKKLVSLLKGQLTLQSSPGKGSTFEVSFPVKLSGQPLEELTPTPSNSHFKLNVIIVDDDVSLRQLLVDVLGQYDVSTSTFEDAKAALSALDDLPYDLIITDIQLPKMNGFHFMETVKKMPSYQQQPIIAMTGRTDINTEEYLNSGFSKVVYKPFKTHMWLDILTELFPDRISQVKKEETNKHTFYHSEYFDTTSIAGFLNYDEEALKSLLELFLNDTKKHITELKTAQQQNDIETIKHLSHQMLTMFKQLNATPVVPILEVFEHATIIDDDLFATLNVKLKAFCEDIETYISPNRTL